MQMFIPSEECDFCHYFDDRNMTCGFEEGDDPTEAECMAIPALFVLNMTAINSIM